MSVWMSICKWIGLSVRLVADQSVTSGAITSSVGLGLAPFEDLAGGEVHFTFVTGPLFYVGHDQQRPIGLLSSKPCSSTGRNRSDSSGIESFSVAGGMVTSVWVSPTTGIRLTAASSSR